ncbi:hypothetical protein [Lysinibacillus varians]|uniref:Pathogenicity island protein n=1 Tax=Lysinibacillus varians TaxID=1145276 RepID=A0ABY2T5Z6_9BACI|nr:hypothetical protein [Lysinibacillus varians]AHN22053.1 pathogenicity island protein [Lysinibacillus varians]TKI52652.1 pathogenicity island protein [Lysinibacillus varians]
MNQINKDILNYINQNPGTSYIEIERIFDANKFNYEGNLDICSSENRNIIFWRGWNEEAINILTELKRKELIEEVATSKFVYLIDGKVLNLPLVTGAYNYKKHHWLPTVFKVKKK